MERAGNLLPSGSSDTFSKVFIKDLTTRLLPSVTVPPESTAGGIRRPEIEEVDASSDGRLLTVNASTGNHDVFEVVRDDRVTGRWTTLCRSNLPRCELDLASPDGRYVVIDGQIHDLATGTLTPAPVRSGIATGQPRHFSGDAMVLVCLVRDIQHGLDVAHLTWYSLPSVALTREATVMSYAVLGGVDRDGSHLALAVDRYEPSHVMLHPQDRGLDPPEQSQYFQDFFATINPT